MKGPQGRWQPDVRRLWECPRCRRRAKTGGQVTLLACVCSPSADQPHWMTLVEEPRLARRPYGISTPLPPSDVPLVPTPTPEDLAQ